MSLAISRACALSFRWGSFQPLFHLGQRCLLGHLFRLHARLQIQQEHLILRKLLTLRPVLFKTRQSKLLLPYKDMPAERIRFQQGARQRKKSLEATPHVCDSRQ
jgi:hypothetical protein